MGITAEGNRIWWTGPRQEVIKANGQEITKPIVVGNECIDEAVTRMDKVLSLFRQFCKEAKAQRAQDLQIPVSQVSLKKEILDDFYQKAVLITCRSRVSHGLVPAS